jgi:hypothetical protein
MCSKIGSGEQKNNLTKFNLFYYCDVLQAGYSLGKATRVLSYYVVRKNPKYSFEIHFKMVYFPINFSNLGSKGSAGFMQND